MIVTVTEKVTIDNPVFLFVFKHLQTSTVKAFILTDTSTHTNRFNEFTFTEGSNAARTLNIGRHEYNIYAQTSAVNIDPLLADELVENGIAEVTTTENEFETNTISQTYKVNVIN